MKMCGMLKYEERGVSPTKGEVHKALINVNKGIFPNSFCKIMPDLYVPDWCSIMHADGAGTKSSIAYLYWKETGDISVWKGIAQDSVVMNLDDLLCVGNTDPMSLSSTIGRNKKLIPGEVIKEIIDGTEEFLEKLRNLGIKIYSSGGETADVGDLVRTIIVDSTISTRMPKKDVIRNNIISGDVIVGLASYGMSTYETFYNSGIGSNGLTSAKHDLLNKTYLKKYPESLDPNISEELSYCGEFLLNEEIGGLLLSPTRTYAPVIYEILSLYREDIHGIIHCTGGGQTKILNFIDNLKIVKDNLFPIPKIFEIIQEQSKTSFDEMYKVFNMGHRMEIYLPEKLAEEIINISDKFCIDAKVIGYCEKNNGKSLVIKSDNGIFYY
jgi:phosphoribosylformylglycinamidine cyclo-ligase